MLRLRSLAGAGIALPVARACLFFEGRVSPLKIAAIFGGYWPVVKARHQHAAAVEVAAPLLSAPARPLRTWMSLLAPIRRHRAEQAARSGLLRSVRVFRLFLR